MGGGRRSSGGLESSVPVISDKTIAKLKRMDAKARRMLHQKLTTAWGSTKPDALFKQIDADGSGEVTLAEFTAFVREKCKIKPDKISNRNMETFFKCLDADDGGTIQ